MGFMDWFEELYRLNTPSQRVSDAYGFDNLDPYEIDPPPRSFMKERGLGQYAPSPQNMPPFEEEITVLDQFTKRSSPDPLSQAGPPIGSEFSVPSLPPQDGGDFPRYTPPERVNSMGSGPEQFELDKTRNYRRGMGALAAGVSSMSSFKDVGRVMAGYGVARDADKKAQLDDFLDQEEARRKAQATDSTSSYYDASVNKTNQAMALADTMEERKDVFSELMASGVEFDQAVQQSGLAEAATDLGQFKYEFDMNQPNIDRDLDIKERRARSAENTNRLNQAKMKREEVLSNLSRLNEMSTSILKSKAEIQARTQAPQALQVLLAQGHQFRSEDPLEEVYRMLVMRIMQESQLERQQIFGAASSDPFNQELQGQVQGHVQGLFPQAPQAAQAPGVPQP